MLFQGDASGGGSNEGESEASSLREGHEMINEVISGEKELQLIARIGAVVST